MSEKIKFEDLLPKIKRMDCYKINRLHFIYPLFIRDEYGNIWKKFEQIEPSIIDLRKL